MDYKEFRISLGEIKVPAQEDIDKFIEAQDSVHFTITLFESPYIDLILNLIQLIELRGGMRGRDYIVTANGKPVDEDETKLKLANITLHTTNSFISREDEPLL